MATEVTRNLHIDYNNAKTYLTANGVSLQINIAGTKVAVRHYMNGAKTGYATINSAGMDVLFPSDTAIPHKLDLGSHIGQLANSNKNWVEFRIDGTALERFPGSTKDFTRTYTNETVRAFRKNSTFMSYHNAPNTVNGTSCRYVDLTLYFTQYSCSANAVGNGIQSASVSNSAPYEGDTVTFTPKLINGATWDGWYSDAACTQLVSTEQNYSVSPSSDITLYAKATIEAVVYSCSAVAGENIASASVSDTSVVSGDSVTFTAQLNEHCTFDGWFSDSNYTTLVSTANPYTATITSDTTLYAKGTKISYSVRVGTAEHGTATVSANTAHYGDSVTFTFTPEDETWELYGWYSDEGLTQLMSEDNPYTYSVTDNVILYPKVGRIRYNIKLTTSKAYYHNSRNEIISYDYALLTETEISYLKTGEFDKIDQNKIYDRSSVEGTQFTTQHTASIKCPFGYAISIYLSDNDDNVVPYISRNNVNLTAWPYYTTFPTEDQEYLTVKGSAACHCEAIIVDGILSTDATTPVSQEKEAIFTADIMPGYTFSGWYSDQACTRLVSADNPAYVTTPKPVGNSGVTYLTLYAKAIDPTTIYTVQVGSQPDDGNASVSASTATYGNVVTFTANITGANREFYGWYSDSSYTNLVSDSATYNHTVTGNTILYPKSGKTRYTAILHPTYASDVRPYRGSSTVGLKAASPSVPQNVNVLANNTVNSSTYAYQSYRASTAHNYGIAFWINNVEQLNSAPDNATIFDLYAQIGLSFSDIDYDSATAYSGTYTYLCEGDETPAIRRGTNVNIPISTNKTIVTINKSQMGDWTIKELKEGKLGFQINTSVKSASGAREQRFYGIDVYVVYTVEDISYKCEAISDGHVDVSVSSHDVVPGGSCTWTAVQEGGYRFDGWYADPNFENLVSTSATYTTTINSNKTLYAKTHYHSRVVARELDVPFGQGRTYFIGKDINGNILDPDVSGSGWKPDFDLASYNWLSNLVGVADVKATAASCNGAEYVSAVINNAGMNILYPNDTAHPVKMDSHALLGRAALTATITTSTLKNPITEDDTITPMVDGVQSRIWRPNNINDVPYNFTNLRLPSILNSTRNSTIEYRMHQYTRDKYRAIGIDDIRLTLYFEEYDFSAQIASDAQGIEAVACSKAIGYEGDSVTYTVTLLPDVVFGGWCTEDGTVVSTDETYTCVPNANLTLYAKTARTTSNFLTVLLNDKSIINTEITDSINVIYNGNIITTVNLGATKILNCKGCIAATDIIIGDYTLNCKDQIIPDNIIININN